MPPQRRLGEDIRRILKGASPVIRDLLLVAHEQQFRVSKTSKCHYKVMTPAHWREQKTTFTPGTPSEYRSASNTRQKLVRLGVKFGK